MTFKSEVNVTPDELEYIVRMVIAILNERNHMHLD